MMNFNIYTLGGGGYLNGILNGVTLITRDGDFFASMKIAMLFGLLTTIARSAYKGALWDWQWFLGAIMLYLAAMAPKATVIVTDNLNGANSSVVSNLPIGLAATAGIAETFGHWATDEFDTVFSLPADLTYDQHGMLFGNAVVDQAMSAQITDPRTAANLSDFFQQCVFYDVLLGRYSMSDLQSSTNMWGFIQSHTSQVRMFSYQPESGPPQVEVCRQSAQTGGDLNTDVEAAVPVAINILGPASCPMCDRTTAISNYSNVLPQATNYLISLSQSASQTLLQTMIANAMQNGIQEWAARANAPAAAVAYAASVAQSQQQTTWATTGYLAEQYMPVVNDLAKGVLFAAFPLVFLLALLPGGWRAALTYCKGLIWLELWSPLFAVLHFAMSYLTSQRAMGVVTLGGGSVALTAQTYSGVGHVMSEFSIIAGYCTTLIPVIAWLLLSGLSSVGSLVGGIIQSYQAPASQASGEATRGNLSLGDVAMFNSSRWQQNDAPAMNYGSGTLTGPDGVTYTHTQNGTFAKMPQSQLPLSVSLDNSVRASVDQQATEAVRAARADSVAAAQGISASMAEIDQLNHQLSTNHSFSDSVNRESAANFQQHVAAMNSIVDELRKGTTLSRTEAAQAVLQGGGSLGAGIAGAGGSLKAGVNAGASMQLRGQAEETNLIDRATKTGLDRRFGEEYAATLHAGEGVASSYGGGDLSSYSKDASSRFSRDAGVVEQAMASVEHARAYQTARSLTEGEGFGSRIALDDHFKTWLTQKLGGNQNAAIELIRTGAQTSNAAAYAELSSYVRDFSQQFAADIARNADLPSTTTIAASGRTDLSNLARTGTAAVGQLHGSSHSRIGGEASAQHLTPPEISAKVSDNHEKAMQTQQDLGTKQLNQSATASLDAFTAKRTAKREEHFDASVPLEVQALSKVKDAGSRPLVIEPTDADAKHDLLKPAAAGRAAAASDTRNDIKVEWPTLPRDAR